MNTCADCRFWKDVDDSARSFTVNPAKWRDEGEFKECTRVNEDGSPMFMATSHSYDDALMTRSDFGCVQFERKGIVDQIADVVAKALPDVQVTVDKGVAPGTYQYPEVTIRTTWPLQDNLPNREGLIDAPIRELTKDEPKPAASEDAPKTEGGSTQ